jgi:periplasmic protein TonB
MFDTVLGKGNVPGGRFGVGTVVSVIVHVGLLAFAIWFSMRPPPEEELDTEVKFFAAPPPPPPPPPPAAAPQPKTEVKKKPVKKPDTIVRPKDPTPQETPPEPAEPQPEQVEGGVVGGVEGGVVGGVIGGQLGGQLGGEVVPFGEGMTRPELIAGPKRPEYTREALEARVEGVMIVRCTITVAGKVENCRIIKPLPHLEQAVLDTLAKQKFKPVTFQGRPVNVDYVFNFRFVLPR